MYTFYSPCSVEGGLVDHSSTSHSFIFCIRKRSRTSYYYSIHIYSYYYTYEQTVPSRIRKSTSGGARYVARLNTTRAKMRPCVQYEPLAAFAAST